MQLELTEQQAETLKYFLEIHLTENISATSQTIIKQVLEKLDENYPQEIEVAQSLKEKIETLYETDL